jgi:hypothetical protein
MVKVTASFVDGVLWPEFQEFNKILREHLDSVTQRIIHQAIHGDSAEVEERPEEQPPQRSQQGAIIEG